MKRAALLTNFASIVGEVAEAYEYTERHNSKLTGRICEKVRDSKSNPKIGRNEPCSCGSGKKHKRCCY